MCSGYIVCIILSASNFKVLRSVSFLFEFPISSVLLHISGWCMGYTAGKVSIFIFVVMYFVNCKLSGCIHLVFSDFCVLFSMFSSNCCL
jgi:hypothetical protein